MLINEGTFAAARYMPNYDFKLLSSFDFEQLVRDVLQKELTVHLESFKQGRDGGIDLRFSQAAPSRAGHDLIVQCKHFPSTPYATLKSQIERKELPKVARLNPAKYLLVTSCGLTPQNKQELANILAPHCKGTADILGMDDVNNLLGKFPEVETAHFKLWLTSTPVMSRVLHSKIFNESAAARERIVKSMTRYVANQSFHEAKHILDSAHYCVIVGVPGIGKTTLAEALIVDHLARDYDVFALSHDIRDAFAVHDSTRKQLFYYDDFLGQTGIADKLQKNEDQALLRFVEATQSSGLTRLVLTTRDYIFNQAKLTYEKIANSRLDQQRCVIDLAAYTKWERSKILFNHVSFSDLPEEYKSALLKDRGYRKILEHANFSPRIVAWMTDLSVHDSTPTERYLEEFVRNLDHPLRLWEHAFNNQLSNASRQLLLCLASFSSSVGVSELRDAFHALYAVQAKRFGFPTGTDDFQRAIKECEATFISVSAPSEHASTLIVTFHNPSIRDFLHSHLEANEDLVRALCDGALYFEQVQRLWEGFARTGANADTTASRTRVWLESSPEHLWRAFARTFRQKSSYVEWDTNYAGRILYSAAIAKKVPAPEARRAIGAMVEFLYSLLKTNRFSAEPLNNLLSNFDWSVIDTNVTANEFIRAAKASMRIGTDEFPAHTSFDQYGAAIEFARRHVDVVSTDERQHLEDLFRERVEEYEPEPDHDFERIEMVAEQIESIAAMCSMGLGSDITRLRERAAELRDEAEARSDDDYDRWREDRDIEPNEDEQEIDNMFDSLR